MRQLQADGSGRQLRIVSIGYFLTVIHHNEMVAVGGAFDDEEYFFLLRTDIELVEALAVEQQLEALLLLLGGEGIGGAARSSLLAFPLLRPSSAQAEDQKRHENSFHYNASFATPWNRS